MCLRRDRDIKIARFLCSPFPKNVIAIEGYICLFYNYVLITLGILSYFQFFMGYHNYAEQDGRPARTDLILKVVITTAQKMKFSIQNFFSKCDQICRFLRIWSHLLKKSLKENFIFCEMSITTTKSREFALMSSTLVSPKQPNLIG